jgi:hypothetical protein
VNRRLRAGVDGGTRVAPEPEAEAEAETTGVGRIGDIDLRGEGGVTSVCSIELKMALACSINSSAFRYI